MEYLIEQMKSLITDPNDSHELQWNIGFKNAISIIEEEKNKPFNPTDFGFRIYEIGDYRVTFIKEIKPCVYIWLNKYGTENYYYSISKTPSNLAPCMIDTAKIKTNFEARIILKSLGVIE